MGKKGVEDIIDQIEVFIGSCKFQALSQTKIIVHKDDLLQLIDELKMRLPSEIERCKKIMRNKEAILADARTRSDAIISESVNEANRLVEQNQITELAQIRANEILEMARNQAQQIVNQASEEANEVRLGAMYYTKDKLTEIHDMFAKIHAMEKENYRTLIESLESDTYVLENNMSEMEANINLLTASSNMSYAMDDDDDLDSAFSSGPISAPASETQSDYGDDIDVYGERATAEASEDDFGDEDDGFEDDDVLED